MKPGASAVRLLVVLAALAANRASAIWPLGESDSDKAAKQASKANAELTTADESWRAGDVARALEFYQIAADDYSKAEEMVPGLENGLIRYRISYCLGQVEQLRNTQRDKDVAPKRVAVTHPSAARKPQEGDATAGDGAPAAGAEAVNVRRELALARQAAVSEHPEDALPSLIRVLKVDPGNRGALLLMATVRVQQGRYDDAIITSEDLRGANEDEAVLLLAAGAYFGAGRYFDALLALDKVLKASPELPQAHIDMAYLLLEMSPDKRADARLYYAHALKLGVPRDAAFEKRLGLPSSP